MRYAPRTPSKRGDTPATLVELLALRDMAHIDDVPDRFPRLAPGNLPPHLAAAELDLSAQWWATAWREAIASLGEGMEPGLLARPSAAGVLADAALARSLHAWADAVRTRVTQSHLTLYERREADAFHRVYQEVPIPATEYVVPAADGWSEWITPQILVLSETHRFDVHLYREVLTRRDSGAS